MRPLRALGRWIRQLARFDDGPKPPSVVVTVCPPGPFKPETMAAIQRMAQRTAEVQRAITDLKAAHENDQPLPETRGARCKVCKRLLVSHDSIERGAGRVCARKLKEANDGKHDQALEPDQPSQPGVAPPDAA